MNPIKHKDADNEDLFIGDRVFITKSFDTAWIVTGETPKMVKLVNERFYTDVFDKSSLGGWPTHPFRIIKAMRQ